MTAAEWLDRADALAAEATDGPWALFLAWDSTHGTNYGVDGPPAEDPWPVMRGGFEEDARFIAAARTDWPKANVALRAVLDRHRSHITSRRPESVVTVAVCAYCIGEYYPCPTVRDVVAALGVEP